MSPRGSGGASPRLPSVRDPGTGLDLSELLKEMRHLRIQLERSIDTNNALRLKLEEMMKTTGQGVKSPQEGHRTSVTTVTMTTALERDRVGKAARSFTPRQLFEGNTL